MNFDSVFIANLKKGNKKSFETLFLHTYIPLCSFAAGITGSKEDAEEVVQDVFAALWQNRMKLAKDLNIKAYLFKSVKNGSLDIVKHQEVRRKYQEQLSAIYLNSPDEVIHSTYIIKRVTEEVEKLPEKNKMVYLLHRRDGLTYSEIAQILDISKKAVEARMSKALTILRDCLKKEKSLYPLALLALCGI